ncbi:hypothetical protein LEP1GSC125_3522 [Leptospira mayottensis 200901122]|uniref:Uncharacterized protein n=1 Tax=Leptospira mayottensis 200901122 TaxID=1193010 RepID=A0AA87MQW2_9LEPT|nr:hypothetical protein LEP1GSC125_3522 [Leptospira mayottensis 200901122]
MRTSFIIKSTFQKIFVGTLAFYLCKVLTIRHLKRADSSNLQKR